MLDRLIAPFGREEEGCRTSETPEGLQAQGARTDVVESPALSGQRSIWGSAEESAAEKLTVTPARVVYVDLRRRSAESVNRVDRQTWSERAPDARCSYPPGSEHLSVCVSVWVCEW